MCEKEFQDLGGGSEFWFSLLMFPPVAVKVSVVPYADLRVGVDSS